jgi:pyruvate/2-oxoglutarate dehydrogenase complex dihydrolipoamide dehydrogenase (E3) component
VPERCLRFGVGVGELLPAIQLAMSQSLPYTALRDLIASHPTLGEGIVVLFSAVPTIRQG